MKPRFENRAVIITGALGGIGLAVARRFAAEGARLTLLDLNADQGGEIVAELKALGAADVQSLACDIGDEAAVAAAVQTSVDRHGSLDVVVNVAGQMIYRPIADLTGDDWRRLLNVNLIGAALLTGHALRLMQPGGSVVNIASIHARQTSPDVAPYAAAKAGLLSLTRTASIEGRAKGVRVNAILPGAIDTPMLWDSPNIASGAEVLAPGDVGQPDDVAGPVLFLASDDARFVTGVSMEVDGGRLAKL
ncbi:SDR family NAD(P)-dependent oxidoreductase [Brevundimonas sp.]|uniref:SDR family NAD(P)-dependent oxidoreductase n=1 Tax=Brevundimonas sp. TaxID=1871086 RepID=UPI0025C07B0B|nr:SDR family NAD(P)-dependent oxidoreductase [Brevundimonas sp.]